MRTQSWPVFEAYRGGELTDRRHLTADEALDLAGELLAMHRAENSLEPDWLPDLASDRVEFQVAGQAVTIIFEG